MDDLFNAGLQQTLKILPLWPSLTWCKKYETQESRSKESSSKTYTERTKKIIP